MSLIRNDHVRALAALGLAALAGLAMARPASSDSPVPAAAWDIALRDARAVDVNQADASELERLPGIGASLAGRIVAERRQRGRFTGPGDLLRVRGIGPATVKRIEMFVSFD